MKTEISEILKKEGINPDEISDNVNDFYNTVKEIGLNEKTKTIKREEISKDLNTEFIGHDLYIYNKVKSTNTLGRFFAHNKCENGAVIISETQSKAKGRQGKSWDSPEGGIALSIVLNPILEVSKAPLITLATGVAVAKTLEKLGLEKVKIKWPNDILIDSKKVSGILTESIAKFNSIEHIIVGVGINVNLKSEDLPETITYAPTSLNMELGEEVNVNKVIKVFLEEFEYICNYFKTKDYDKILNSWRKRSFTIGKEVKVHLPFGGDYEGYVVGMNKEGALVVEKSDGTYKKVIAGEVLIK